MLHRDYFVAVVRTPEVSMYAVNQSGEIVSEKKFQFSGSYSEILSNIRSFVNRQRNFPRQGYIVLDMEADYYRLSTDGPKNKRELAGLLDLGTHDYFGYYEKSLGDNKYVYYVLSYSAELVNRYLNLAVKLKSFIKAIVPLDLLFLQTGQAGIYLERHQNGLFFKAFDGTGHYYYKRFAKPEDLTLEKEKLFIYLKRERIINSIEDLLVNQVYFEHREVVANFERYLQESFSVYTEKKQLAVAAKKKLTTAQKIFLSVFLVVLLLVGVLFVQKTLVLFQIERDIHAYEKQLKTSAAVVQNLQQMEKNTKYFKKILITKPVLAKKLLQLCETGKIRVISFNLNEQMPLVLVGKDLDDSRYKLIKTLQGLPEVSAVNLIYARYEPGSVEFKIIITGK